MPLRWLHVIGGGCTLFPHAGGEEVTVPAILPVMAGTPGSTRWAGPELGEHTEEILQKELGMGEEEIRRLRECGAI